jgi:hypothetical protein
MAVATAWAGWYTIGVPRDTAYRAANKKGMLVWGGASSIGSTKLSIYTTASEKHHEYLKGLGASKVFDYRGEYVVESIAEAAKEDGVTVQMGFDAVDELKSCTESPEGIEGGRNSEVGVGASSKIGFWGTCGNKADTQFGHQRLLRLGI